MRSKMKLECLGKTPGYVRYSGYDTREEEDEFLPILGPIWCDGDPIPAEGLLPRNEKPWSVKCGDK
jgi:hypothetical protein